MIELDENGNIPKLTQFRVYVVAGFDDGRPFKGFNIWSDRGPVSQERIEQYPTFKGWATDTLSTDAVVDNVEEPVRPGQFRVALFERPDLKDFRYVALDQGKSQIDLEGSPGFLGWLIPTYEIALPEPVPAILVRFRHEVAGDALEGLFITNRQSLQAALGRTVNFGRLFGAPSDLVVTLEARHFMQLSDNQVRRTWL